MLTFHTDNFEIRWRNFRAFSDTGWVVLRPLTILVGPNNCGKSSIIAPLLLMNQTIASRDTTSPLVSRGPLVDVGSYRDFITNKDTKRELGLDFRFHPHKPDSRELRPLGNYPPGSVSLTFEASDDPSGMRLASFGLDDVHGRKMLRKIRQDDGKYSLTDDCFSELTLKERLAIESSKPTNFLFSPAPALRNYERDRDDSEGEDASDDDDAPFSADFSLYLRTIGFAFSELQSLFRKMSYVGPLRDRPQRSYQFGGENLNSIGSRGESMAQFLSQHMVEFQDDIDRWVSAFEFGDGLRLQKIDDIGGALFFEKGGDKFHTNVAHSGFGASQILPLIIQAVAAPKNNMIIAEQPELHLNPRLQAKLGTLFAEIVKRDEHRVIVETHSEHLLLSIRTLIALGELPASYVSLLFVETEDGEARIRQVTIEEDGSIARDEWPKGFLGEGLQQALALSSAQSKRLTNPKGAHKKLAKPE